MASEHLKQFAFGFTTTNKTPVDILSLAFQVHQVLQYHAKKKADDTTSMYKPTP